MAEYEIWYSDSLGNNRRMLQTWGGFRVSRRLNTIGQLHELLIPLDDAPSVLQYRDSRVEIWRDGKLLLDTIWYVRSLGQTDKDNVRWLRLGGFDALYHLDGRIVAYASDSSEAIKTDPADDVIKAYARENFGSLAIAARDQSVYISVEADRSLGPTVYRRAARQKLWRLFQGICFESAQRGTPLYVDLIPQPDGTMELRTFTTARGMDHRHGGLGPIAISVEVGTLAESDRTQNWADEHTFVYVGGRGLAGQRLVVEVEDTARTGASPFGRRETWIDARHLSTVQSLTSAGYSILWQGLPDERIVGVAREGFGDTWGYGDLVEAAFGETVADCRIDEVEIIVDGDRRETPRVWLYELAAEVSLLTTAQQVEDMGTQESPEYTETPTPYAVPLAHSTGFIDDGWLSAEIARVSDLVGVYQPLDADLTAIAALSTTSYGRGFLPLADAAAARSYIGAGTGGGTVTSVGLTAPSFLSVSGSPIITSGTLALSLATQSANTGLFGPTTGAAAAPTFRVLVAADIPSLDAAKITSGVLPSAQGGTGINNGSNNLTVPATGTAALLGATQTFSAVNTFSSNIRVQGIDLGLAPLSDFVIRHGTASTGTIMRMSPNGNGIVTSAAFQMFNTDWNASQTNFELFTFGWNNDIARFLVQNGGTGAQRDMSFINTAGSFTLRATGGYLDISQYIQLTEITAPAAGAANTGRLYLEDNGSGKTRLVVKFNTGAGIVLATQV